MYLPIGFLRRPMRVSLWALYSAAKFFTRGFRRIAIMVWLVLGLMGAVTFTQFIFEEALQTAGFTCYGYRASYREYKDPTTLNQAEFAMENFEAILGSSKWFNTWFGWINPLTKRAYQRYNQAAQGQLDGYKFWLKQERTALAKREAERRAKGESTDGVETVKAVYTGKNVCYSCQGTGRRAGDDCQKCGGSGEWKPKARSR